MSAARLLTTALLASSAAVLGPTVPAGASPAARVDGEATSTYVCSFPVVGDLEVPLTLDAFDVPDTLTTGVPVAAGAFGVDGALRLPALAVLALRLDLGLVEVEVGAEEIAMDLGGTPLPVGLRSDPESLDDVVAGEPLEVWLTGDNGAFTPGPPGRASLRLPRAFEFSLGDGPVAGVPCALSQAEEEPAEASTVRVTKQQASMKGRVLDKQVVKGKRAKVLVTVWNEVNRGATGVVVATVRGRQVGTGTLRGGAARIRLPRLKVGTWPVRLAYTGSDTVEAVSKQVKVTVVKPPKRR